MLNTILRVAALVLAALSLGLSFAHLLEAPPRLHVWPPELWRETTNFHGQYALFGSVGGPIEVAAVLAVVACAAIGWRQADGRIVVAAAAVLFALALAVWLSVVNPANGIMAHWRPGPLPDDFRAVQLRWESGHMIMAVLKLLGFAALSLGIVRSAPA
jgi:hypothetical protein